MGTITFHPIRSSFSPYLTSFLRSLTMAILAIRTFRTPVHFADWDCLYMDAGHKMLHHTPNFCTRLHCRFIPAL